MSEKRLEDEIASFQSLWEGGYHEGDPLEPLGRSSYRNFGYTSILHATYLRCIKPYVRPETVALEIGPGRGAWTRSLLPAKEVWALDALSAEYNRFFEYVGRHDHVKYLQVQDFECEGLPEEHFDYMFSFGCMCHISFEGISAYARNLFPKLRSGANCFWFIADRLKYDTFAKERSKYDIWKSLTPKRASLFPLGLFFRAASRFDSPESVTVDPFADGPGKWYDAGTERTCGMLEDAGYRVLDSDVQTLPRDPIIHFVKP